MKSITKKLSLLLLLSTALIFSSCLDSSGYTHTGDKEYSYIEESEFGTIYARTAWGYFITSPVLNEYSRGDIVLLSYEVSDENEVITTGDNLMIYRVDLTAKPTKLRQEPLQLRSAPENDTTYFESIVTHPGWFRISTGPDQYFGDRWPLTIQYKAGKEDKATISFYLVDEGDLPEDFDGDILIDIRLERSGTLEENSDEKLKNEDVVVNLSEIRKIYSGDAPTDPNDFINRETKDLKIKFRYFRFANEGELHISREPVLMRVIK